MNWSGQGFSGLPQLGLLLVVLCLSCSWLQGAHACGVTTHVVIATRAQRWLTDNYPALRPYASLVQANLPAFQNGAAFPDWGYACPLARLGFPQLPAMSEAAHWPPFQAAVVAHVLARYPATSSGGTTEWSPEAQAVIAFLLGVVSHSVADITWHDLTTARETQQGFIQALAEADYALRDQSYNSTQHSAADTYGEFIAAYELDLSFLSDEWYLPAEDLAQVFASLNFTVPPAVIEICVGELYAEVMAMKYLGKILYPGFAEDVPFMVDHYQDYWIGGVNDMATWTMQCWPNVLAGLDTGRPIQFCFEQGGPGAVSATARGRRESLANAMRPYASQIAYDRTRTSAGGVLYASPSVKPGRVVSPPPPAASAWAAGVSHKETGGQLAASCEPQTGPALGSSLTFTLPVGYSDAGRSLAVGDLDGDGLEDLVIGAPGFAPANGNLSQSGAVFVVYGASQLPATVGWHRTIDLLAPPAATRVAALHGAASNARFGQAVAVLDFNLDGLLDLAVSAPGIGFEDLSYYGEVQVFLGRKGPGGLSFSAEPNVTISGRSRTWTNLGYTLAADCDLDGDGHRDLVIGSPYARGATPLPSWERFAFQRGAVSAFLARKAPTSFQPKKGRLLDWRTDADWFQEGAAMYDWFGTALVCRAFRGENSSGEAGQLLVVSSPGAADVAKGRAGLGRIDGFLFSSSSAGLKARHVFGVSGAQRFDHLGQSLALGSSGPTTVLSAGRDEARRSTVSTTMTASGPLWLAVGLPARALHWGITLQQAGAVVLLDVERDLFGRLNATIDQLAARATIESEQSFARLGELVLSADLDGDGADDLLVASPHYDPDLSLLDAGAVYVWKGQSSSGFPATGAPVPPDSAWLCFHGDREYALYGEQAAVLDFDGDGRPDLALAGPRDSRTGAQATHAGSVTLVLR